jgi:hypothetical protein
MPVPKPRAAWWLVFLGGPLENAKDKSGKPLELWNVTCPDDWAYTKDGVTHRYRLKESDEVRRVATMELIQDA